MDTIYALSSGAVPSGVAVIRISGPGTREILKDFTGRVPEPRRAVLATLRRAEDGAEIDRGLVFWFPAPRSFTGEDLAEVHLHGSAAVIRAIFDSLSKRHAIRPATAGEFSRRAFSNGKLDLTEVEGIADLIAAETEVQRKQAIGLAGGTLSRAAESWRDTLVGLRAELEAQLDFSDEGDVPAALEEAFWRRKESLAEEIRCVLAGARSGERIREGFRVALLGPPNAGKSTLLNALARRDVAIVTAEPGTTRDVLALPLNIAGFPVTIFDTAGLREPASLAEQEAVRRARLTAEAADLLLWLEDVSEPRIEPPDFEDARLWRIATKVDLAPAQAATDDSISAVTGIGMDRLIDRLREAASGSLGNGSSLISRERQRLAVRDTLDLVDQVGPELPPEVNADLLRGASDAIARLSGRTHVEDVLDRLFAEFCIGK